ncbi:TonB-dependent receptor [Siphonobacter sp. SORGH_AS_1065]|uniref:SusC/RagA family TonB-linked outer membrane protein n=1 Tax=Siphonobacter sp. SORGH_AS_1065 TaxID=3041795 RepID=UPI00277D7A87|nr:TonB-dependent receptor [Siphonobacter sp. SORGH_AS_1065]MDQ1090175.1 TonB-linked SusC/RagA family outer membrane protein [Siphonobacter sp. SORGH_AS_1065]
MKKPIIPAQQILSLLLLSYALSGTPPAEAAPLHQPLLISSKDLVIQGKVTAQSDGTPLPGVSVAIKGTTVGTTTDANGNYQLRIADAKATLVFSFVGFISQEVIVGTRTRVDIHLESQTSQLNEVVVVGYGTQQKRDLTGSIATISGKDLAAAPVQSFDQALQGRAAGVNISTPGGALNATPVIRIRGINSINLSSFPLVVVDGVPTYTDNISTNSASNNPLSNINPADIESVEVLKDASATAIYGSRASAGVILITTKQGKKGNVKVSLDSWVSWSNPYRLNKIQMLGAEDFVTLKNEALANAGQTPGYALNYDANGNLIDTDYKKLFYQNNGFSQSHALSFSGGSERTNYYVSLGYTDQAGIVKHNEFDRKNARVKIDHKLFKTFTIGANFAISNTSTLSVNSGSVSGEVYSYTNGPRLALSPDPNLSPYNSDGSYNIGSGGLIGQMNNRIPSIWSNLAAVMDNDRYRSSGAATQGSLYANWEIIKGLNIRTQYGIDRLSVVDESYESPLTPPGVFVGGSATSRYRNNYRWNWQNTAQYDFSLAGKHNISLLIGNEQQLSTVDRWGLNRTNQSDPLFRSVKGNFVNTVSVSMAQTENFLLSYFGRLNYDFGKKYFATLNFRRDGYSAFASGKKFGNFYGASLGYSISDETFWANSAISRIVSYLKFRGSYGLVGNNQGINDYASLQSYAAGLQGDSPTLYYDQAGNRSLSWETSKKTDFGFAFGLLNDRITGEIAYYQNDVDGLILNVPQASSKGIPSNSLLLNIGSMQNTGLEFSVQAHAVRTDEFSWKINANVTTLKNKVISLNGDNQRIINGENVIEIGKSVSSLWAVTTLGVNPENGRRLFQKADGTVVQYDHSASASQRWTTLEGTSVSAATTLADGRNQGPALPKWYGGFDNTFTYKNFDLGLFLQFSGGNKVLNGTKPGTRDQRGYNNSTDLLDRWTPNNKDGKLPRAVYGDNISNGGAAISISENIEKGDFARLRNVSLGYKINPNVLNRLHISSARVYAQVQNALVFTKYSGYDPESTVNGNSNTGPGVDRNALGQTRTVSLGITIGF